MSLFQFTEDRIFPKMDGWVHIEDPLPPVTFFIFRLLSGRERDVLDPLTISGHSMSIWVFNLGIWTWTMDIQLASDYIAKPM